LKTPGRPGPPPIGCRASPCLGRHLPLAAKAVGKICRSRHRPPSPRSAGGWLAGALAVSSFRVNPHRTSALNMRLKALARTKREPNAQRRPPSALDRAPPAQRAPSHPPQARGLLSRSAHPELPAPPPTAGVEQDGEEIWPRQLGGPQPWSRRITGSNAAPWRPAASAQPAETTLLWQSPQRGQLLGRRSSGRTAHRRSAPTGSKRNGLERWVRGPAPACCWNPYFSASKIRLLCASSRRRGRCCGGELCFATVNSLAALAPHRGPGLHATRPQQTPGPAPLLMDLEAGSVGSGTL